jgi:5-methylcytosine-specific restriction endonuclease McrA
MDRYYDQFRLAWIRFHKDTDDVYALQLLNGYDNSKEKRNRFAMFKDNHGKGSVNRWLDNIKWIENRFMDCDTLIEDGILVVKQSRKTLTKELREQILQSQDNKCYIDGKPLKFKDAHAAHIVPLDEGGSNDRGNIRMVRAEHNTRMGTMNLEDYKDMWYNKPKAA